MKNLKLYLSFLFAFIVIFQFRDIIASDYKIILFIGLLFVLFGIIYYFTVKVFYKGKDE